MQFISLAGRVIGFIAPREVKQRGFFFRNSGGHAGLPGTSPGGASGNQSRSCLGWNFPPGAPSAEKMSIFFLLCRGVNLKNMMT